MRKIKFRAKQINDNTWISGYGVIIGDGFCAIPYTVRGNTYDWKLTTITCDINTLGQYTGLKDKNGKEIYEGDIVEWVFFYERLGANMGVKECDTIVKGIIRWRQGGFILEVIENDFENAGYYSISALHTDTESDVEIIGNIYDTPELIKEEEK